MIVGKSGQQPLDNSLKIKMPRKVNARQNGAMYPLEPYKPWGNAASERLIIQAGVAKIGKPSNWEVFFSFNYSK